MTYAHKLVYRYTTGEYWTSKLAGSTFYITSEVKDSLYLLVTINQAFFVDYHTPDGRVTRVYSSGGANVTQKKPPRTTNPNSKTKMQKRAEAIQKHKEATERCRDFLRNLQGSILKDAPPSKYHFWLGENV